MSVCQAIAPGVVGRPPSEVGEGRGHAEDVWSSLPRESPEEPGSKACFEVADYRLIHVATAELWVSRAEGPEDSEIVRKVIVPVADISGRDGPHAGSARQAEGLTSSHLVTGEGHEVPGSGRLLRNSVISQQSQCFRWFLKAFAYPPHGLGVRV
jgi:hypothetical protein